MRGPGWPGMGEEPPTCQSNGRHPPAPGSLADRCLTRAHLNCSTLNGRMVELCEQVTVVVPS